MTTAMTLAVNGRDVAIEGERNLLEVIRKAKIDLPTFCYHSDLSIYGACRMCMVEVEGRGLVAACSTPPEAGLKVRTHTEEIREIRRMSVELLLAGHQQACPTCVKADACQLRELGRKLGVTEVRFRPAPRALPVDRSTASLVRDPNKCILCGDCVRVCSEIQGIGAIDFIHRGAKACVAPAFGKELGDVECVLCGQCAAVCPTGAITPKSETEDVWRALSDPRKTVVAQVAPAVRVALGECFGLEPGALSTGQIVAALRALGFEKVFDTCFAADLTVMEEVHEFVARKKEGRRLPQFTSCCPAWVKFAEQYYPELLPNLSTCRSPQQMFGALAKDLLPAEYRVAREDLVVVSIMPCTAKKFEARRPEFARGGAPDVDHVLTTQELARMIEEAGLRFRELEPDSLDMPFGFKSGAGVIFGATGGVMEAALRLGAETLSGRKIESVEFHAVRGEKDLREAVVTAGEVTLKVAVVHGLARARALAEKAKAGACEYDFVEVMACPGGCVGGAGQPVSRERAVVRRRARGLYDADKTLELHKAQENPYVRECYERRLGRPGSETAHEMLHTRYRNRRRIASDAVPLTGEGKDKLQVSVCVGTSCYLRGSQELLQRLVRHVEERGIEDRVDVNATFCFERCSRGPTVRVNGTVIEKCGFAEACARIEESLAAKP